MVVTRHMKRVSQLRSFSASRSSTTEVAEQDSEGIECLEEVRGWVSIRKSSEKATELHDWMGKEKQKDNDINNYYNKELQDSRTKIVTLPWKKINPKMEKK